MKGLELVQVWKYPVRDTGVIEIEMPDNSHIIRVDQDPRDREHGAIWAVGPGVSIERESMSGAGCYVSDAYGM